MKLSFATLLLLSTILVTAAPLPSLGANAANEAAMSAEAGAGVSNASADKTDFVGEEVSKAKCESCWADFWDSYNTTIDDCPPDEAEDGTEYLGP